MSTSTYHHGNLRTALVEAALELLESGDESDLSLRAVARQAGVSPSAPYRHYPDREALVSAVAAVGYLQLAERLAEAHPSPSTPDQLADVAVAYVRFALDRPALFRIMFSEGCDDENPDRVAAVEAVSAYVKAIAERTFPDADAEALSTAIWSLVHGLAFLHLDGKLPTNPQSAVEDRVRTSVLSLLPPDR